MTNQTEYKYYEEQSTGRYDCLIQSEGELIGNARLRLMPHEKIPEKQTSHTWFRIDDFQILKEHRKQGWGKILLEEMSKPAKSKRLAFYFQTPEDSHCNGANNLIPYFLKNGFRKLDENTIYLKSNSKPIS